MLLTFKGFQSNLKTNIFIVYFYMNINYMLMTKYGQ